MPDYSIIACSEEHNTASLTGDFTSGWSGSVTLRCAWSNRLALIADLVGNRRPFPGTGLTIPPQCTSASCVPDGGAFSADGQTIVYSEGLVTANYSTEIIDLVSEVLEPRTEYRTMDYRRFRWGSATGDALLESEAPGMLMKSFDISRTLYQITSIPALYLTAGGHCNNASHTSALLGLTFPAETLMFQPGSIQRTITTAGASKWTVNMKFLYNPNGWNTYYRAKTQTWTRQYLAGGSVWYNSPLVDMSPLLA